MTVDAVFKREGEMNLKLYKWIPSLYIMQGLPFAFVCVIAPIFYKSFNVNNAHIALYTSLFATPWFLKPILSPLLETLASRHTLILSMQFLIAGFILLLACTLNLTHVFLMSGILFFCIGLLASIHDINSDGLYLLNLNTQQQTNFIGIRTLFYQTGKLLCQAGLLFIVGLLLLHFDTIKTWEIGFILCSATIFIIAIYHKNQLPKDAVENPVGSSVFHSFRIVMNDLIRLPNLYPVILFTLFFNLAEAQLMKIVPLFLLDKITHNNLSMSIKDVGIIYGGVGSTALICGILCGSFLLTRFSLKKVLLTTTALACLVNCAYLLFSLSISLIWVTSIITVTEFFYGLSNAAFMMFLLNVFSKGYYPMSLYAIGTSIMGLGVLLSSAISGYLQNWLGYQGFFIWIVGAGVIIILITLMQKDYATS